MSFLYPLGLLGLIGIPILIIIYIIKNKYTEQTVSSTYIWTLSEKFLKRKNPINKLAGIISLILQILIVLFLSFGIAHPVFTMPGMAERYTFIIDCSGSMRISDGEGTRFDAAKSAMTDMVNSSVEGSTYTFISVGNVTTVYEETTDKDRVLTMLSQAKLGYTQADFDDALSNAQEIFDANPSVKTYLFTDKDFEQHDNVEVVNVAADASGENYAVYSVSESIDDEGLVTGSVISFEGAAELTVRLTVNTAGTPFTAEQNVSVAGALVEAPFSFDCSSVGDYSEYTVEILQSDSLPDDNGVTVYSVASENSYDVLIVSGDAGEGSGFYLENLLISTGIADVTYLSEDDYTATYLREGVAPAAPSGYGLYVFDCFNPQVLPDDGTVWLIGLDSALPDASFSVQGDVTLDFDAPVEYSDSTSTTVRQILDGLVMGDMYVHTYIKCSPYRNYTTLISYSGNPLVFTTQTAHGNREVVFAFSLAQSDAPVTADMIMLVYNLIEYSFPAVVDDALYSCGDTALINIAANTDSVRVESPSGKISYLDNNLPTGEVLLDETGTYKIITTTAGTSRTYRIYSAFPIEESNTTQTGTAFLLTGEKTDEGYDGVYDDLLILVIILAVLFLADWVVYCYEQYQLR